MRLRVFTTLFLLGLFVWFVLLDGGLTWWFDALLGLLGVVMVVITFFANPNRDA